MVNHSKSPLFKAWENFVFLELKGKPMPPGWLKEKARKWRVMKEDGLIDVEALSIRKRRVYKRGRKRGRRKKKC